MKFSDAVKLLESGKKIRIKGWGKNKYIYLNKDGYVYSADMNGGYCFGSRAFSEVWEEYIELVTAGSLNPGDKFIAPNFVEYIVLPDYLRNVANCSDSDIPLIANNCHKVITVISKDSLVTKV